MNKFTMQIEMGAKCRDIVSGFEGIVSAYTVHLTGCDVVAIKSRDLDKDGKVPDPLWVDVTRVERLGPPPSEIAGIISRSAAKPEKPKTGGPQDRSKRFSDI